MKITITILILFAFTIVWGQTTKKKTYESKSPPYKETYYVLQGNQDIKHGNYRKIYKKFSAQGQFDNGKKVGVWEFTGSEGQVEQKIDFTNNIVTNLNPLDISEGYWLIENNNYIEVKPEIPPIFIGGRSWFNYYSWTLLRYPSEARINGIQGKVYLSATITKNGQMIDEKVEKGLGYGLDEEALRVFKQIPDDWIPAKINSELVDIRVVIPVSFKLL